MALIEMLRANARLVAESRGRAPPASSRPTLVIAASCPTLSGVVAQALGIEPGAAVVIQLSGAWGGRHGEELLRSVVMALHVHDCEEIVVVGSDADEACPPSRQRVRRAIKRCGLQTDSEQAQRLLELARGPASPTAGVQATVDLLRNTPLVPDSVPVHGCLWMAESGRLKVIDQDERAPAEARRREERGDAHRRASDASAAPDIPLPELPDVPLPEIPELNLDELTSCTAPRAARPAMEKRVVDYGSGLECTGPLSMPELQKMPPAQAPGGLEPGGIAPPDATATGLSIATPEVRFEVPETAAIQDTGLGALDAMFPGQPEPPQAARPGSGLHALPNVRPKADVKSKARVTPAPQRPLGEREIDLDEKAAPAGPSAHRRVMADIETGTVFQDGSPISLDPQLQKALIRVSRFLAEELTEVDRRQILGRVRQSAGQARSIGEPLKVMIGPVLKLGKKRYAVLNELLKIKEDLPRLSTKVALALLEAVLSDE